MFQRPSRKPVTAIALVLALAVSLLPVAAPADAADSRLRVRLPLAHTNADSSLLERLERWRTALWKDVVSLWGKAGARIDDNGKS